MGAMKEIYKGLENRGSLTLGQGLEQATLFQLLSLALPVYDINRRTRTLGCSKLTHIEHVHCAGKRDVQ